MDKTKKTKGIKGSEVPAIAGGNPVRDRGLPYATQWITRREIDAAARALRGEWITSGPTIDRFEEALCRELGCKNSVAVNNCTSALIIAVRAAGIGPGDEVITTPITFNSTALSIVESGGRPVLVDVEDDTLNLDPKKIEPAITSRTRALLPVHYGGHPCDMKPIREIARKHKLLVIEDAAHAVSAWYRGERVGSKSLAACFSFHPVKNMTTAEGGAVASAQKEFAARCRKLRFFGIDRDPRMRARTGGWHYSVEERGLKANLTDIQAAIGLVQLERLDGFQRRRHAIVERYNRLLGAEPAIRLPVQRKDCVSAWHLFPIRVLEQRLKISRDEFFKALRMEGIGVNVHYIPIHYHPYWNKLLGLKPGSLPVAESAFRELVTLPLFPKMKNADVDDVVDSVLRICDYFRR